MIKRKTIIWAGYVAHTSEKRRALRNAVGNPEEMRAARRSKRIWQDKVKWVINIGMGFAECINVTQSGVKWQTLVNTGMNPRVP